jgi:hypothetical protein
VKAIDETIKRTILEVLDRHRITAPMLAVQLACSQRAAASAPSSGRELDSARRGSMHRIDHGLKHRQAAGRQSNASPDHDTVVSLSRERPLYLGSGYFIGLNQAQVRAPSAFGHMLQGQGNAGMDFLGVRARRKYGVSEIHGLWLLPYEQNMRHLIILTRLRHLAGTPSTRNLYRALAPLST